MIVSRCPVRISVAGGSTDLESFISKHGRGAVVSFSANIYTYITVFRDRFGQNTVEDKYNIVWSRTENVTYPSKIRNDIARVAITDMSSGPLHCWFTADVSSTGSGLASSSSHMVALVSALNNLEGHNLTKPQIISRAWTLEKRFNPLTGFQDPWGVASGGLNLHEKKFNEDVISTALDSSIFKKFKMYLLPSNFNRSSTTVLEKVKDTVDTDLLKAVEDMRFAIITRDKKMFMDVVKWGWDLKKNSSSMILGNQGLIDLDAKLEKSDYILAHRLLGAGNGGYFLLFTDLNTSQKKIEKDFSTTVLPVSIDYNGINTLRM